MTAALRARVAHELAEPEPAKPVVLAIDPGSVQSAFVIWADRVVDFGIWLNETLVAYLRRQHTSDVVVIEKVESYGMAVGAEVFETVRWAGRFEEASQPRPVVYLPRREIKLSLCGSPRAKDSNIRQALLDRFGGSSAVGRKAHPGPLYGISRDVWAALAVAVTYTQGAHP